MFWDLVHELDERLMAVLFRVLPAPVARFFNTQPGSVVGHAIATFLIAGVGRLIAFASLGSGVAVAFGGYGYYVLREVAQGGTLRQKAEDVIGALFGLGVAIWLLF